MTAGRSKKNSFVGFLGSVRLALILLSVIIAVSFAGAILPQELQPQLYYSWWFIAILFAFGINLLACILSKISFSIRKIASTVTHFSVLVIMAGALISFLFSERGTIEFSESEEKDFFINEKGQVMPLGFSARLVDFSTSWYPQEIFRINFSVKDGPVKSSVLLKLNEQYAIKNTGYSFAIKEYLPDFTMDENGIPKNISPDPRNPAVLLAVRNNGKQENRWAFALHPEMSFGEDENIKFMFLSEPVVKEFRSEVIFQKASAQETKVIKVNSPASYDRFTFYQMGFDEERPAWTALEVVSDPGVPVVYTGFVLLNLGILLIFAQKIARGKKRSEMLL